MLSWKAKLAIVVASVSMTTLARAQTSSPYPVYDYSSAWGLSNAGVPPGPYVKVEGGHSWASGSRFDDDWVYGAGLGYRFLPWFRSDVTFDYRPGFHDADTGGARFRNWSAMLNGYVDLNVPIIRPLIPYVGAGAGIAQNKVNGTVVTVGGTTVASATGSTKNQFAWQAMAGAAFYFTPTLALDFSYRYFHGGAAENGTAVGFPTRHGDFNTHELVAAVRVGF